MTYEYRVQCLGSAFTEPISVTTGTAQLVAPTLTLSITDHKTIVIEWGMVLYADSIVVEYQKDGAGDTWLPVMAGGNITIVDTKATITGLEADVTYNVRASAIGSEAYMSSGWGTESVTTLPRLLTPTIGNVSGTTTAIVVNWTIDPAADSYVVEWLSGGVWVKTGVSIGSGMATIAGAFTADTTYNVRVIAKAEIVNYDSEPVATVVSIPPEERIDAPVISLNGSVLEWDAVPNAFYYRIEYGTPDSIPGDFDHSIGLSTFRSFDFKGYAHVPGNYHIRVVALKADGTTESEPSNSVTWNMTIVTPEEYNAHDWNKVEVAKINNGLLDEHVTWAEIDGEYRLFHVDAGSVGLSGNLDLSGCTALMYLNCHDNFLVSLDVSDCTALESLYCGSNQLTELDVSTNMSLMSLACHSNKLSVLNVSNNVDLTFLSCSSNQLMLLDVSKNENLTSLYCSSNQLTKLDVSKNTSLTYLICEDNRLIVMDVSQSTALTYLNCSFNHLTFSRLPMPSNNYSNYYYTYQSVTATLGSGNVVDLSSEYLGGSTTYSWFYANGAVVNPSLYTAANGIFTFTDLNDGDVVFCEMTNDNFPDLTLQTSDVKIGEIVQTRLDAPIVSVATADTTHNSITLTWQTVSRASDYQVQYHKGTSGTWQDWTITQVHINGSTATITFIGLDANQLYNFHVCSLGATTDEHSVYSTPITETTKLSLEKSITNPSGTGYSATVKGMKAQTKDVDTSVSSVALTWTPSTKDAATTQIVIDVYAPKPKGKGAVTPLVATVIFDAVTGDVTSNDGAKVRTTTTAIKSFETAPVIAKTVVPDVAHEETFETSIWMLPLPDDWET